MPFDKTVCFWYVRRCLENLSMSISCQLLRRIPVRLSLVATCLAIDLLSVNLESCEMVLHMNVF
jgi:hypothetical protein